MDEVQKRISDMVALHIGQATIDRIAAQAERDVAHENLARAQARVQELEANAAPRD